MTELIVGLILFLGVHSVRIVADPWRTRMIQSFGERPWKGLVALCSLAGFALIIWGFRIAGPMTTVLYAPPAWLRHLNALFTLAAFILVVSANGPRNHFKSTLGHPMVAGVKVWALGHLLATGTLRDALLFGAFLVWAVADFMASRRRDRQLGIRYPAGTLAGDAANVAIGLALWAAFAFWLHLRWIGVYPFA